MNYTEKYHLPQWVKEDRIMMEDFNAAMAAIEGGMTANAQAAEQAAQLPYVVGAYTGNGAAIRDIHVGFRPSFVIVFKEQQASNTSYGGYRTLIAGPTVDSKRLYFLDNGFRIHCTANADIYPEMNTNEKVYNYIAFR